MTNTLAPCEDVVHFLVSLCTIDESSAAQYAATLCMEGYDTLASLHDVDDAEWAEFKVVKNGHLKRIKQQLGVRLSVEAVSDERVSRHSGTDISEARDKLRQFVDMDVHGLERAQGWWFFLWGFRLMGLRLWKFHLQLGGMEGINVLVQLAKMDDDSDGKISATETEKFISNSRELSEAVASLCLNSGVIAALFISILYPIAITVDMPEASGECDDFFGGEACLAFEIIALSSVQISLCLSVKLLFVALRMYTGLAFWMPTAEARIKYLRLNATRLSELAGEPMGVILFAILALPFMSVITAPWVGIGSTFLVLCCLAFADRFNGMHDTSCLLVMQQEARAILQRNV